MFAKALFIVRYAVRRGTTSLLLAIIGAYKVGISPFIGQNCRFEPGCSTYAVLAIRKHGPWRGLRLAIGRIGRCHPWSRGGIDYPPSVDPPS